MNKKSWDNIKYKERSSIYARLKKKRNLIITPADNGRAVVSSNRYVYINERKVLLSNKENNKETLFNYKPKSPSDRS